MRCHLPLVPWSTWSLMISSPRRKQGKQYGEIGVRYCFISDLQLIFIYIIYDDIISQFISRNNTSTWFWVAFFNATVQFFNYIWSICDYDIVKSCFVDHAISFIYIFNVSCYFLILEVTAASLHGEVWSASVWWWRWM